MRDVAFESTLRVRALQARGKGNDFELIPTVQMESQHSVGVPTCHDFLRFLFILEKSRPKVESRWRYSSKSWRFLKKRHLTDIFTNVFRKHSWRHRSTSCVNISWNLTDWKSVKSCVIYLTKNEISARAPALASARIAPKICQGHLETIYSEFRKFHPNPFTSGGVTAERVNIVEMRHEVFPILGEASSPSKNACIKIK